MDMKRKIRGSSAGKTAYEIARDKAEAGEDDDDGKMMAQKRTDLCALLFNCMLPYSILDT
jgi:hypothetical protein